MSHPTPQPVQPGVHTHTGSCACGAVRYEVDLDLSAGTYRCNCTRCTKSGWWGVIVRPSAFRLLQGADVLAPLNEGSPVPRRRCGRCGLESFAQGELDALGGPFVSINIRCLDDVDWTGVPVRHLDGKNNTWAELGVVPWRHPLP